MSTPPSPEAQLAFLAKLQRLFAEGGRHLFAVGDDWQSINRFAGADLAVMTEFEEHFGQAVTLKMETTFRWCSSALGPS